MNQYAEIFIEETKEHLAMLNKCLLELEKNSDDDSVLNEIFRSAHTMKGMSGTMGFNKMAGLTHDMENLLHAIRNKKISVSENVVDLLFKCVDALESYLDCIINEGNEGNKSFKDIVDRLSELLGSSTEERKKEQAAADISLDTYELDVIEKAMEKKLSVFSVKVTLNKDCVLKSARAYIVFRTLENISDIIKSQPVVNDIEEEKFGHDFTVVIITAKTGDEVKKEIKSISEIEQVQIDTVEHLIAEAKSTAKKGKTHEKAESVSKKQSQDAAKTANTVRVEISRLDDLLNLVSELIIQKTRLREMKVFDESKSNNDTIEYMERIITSLHESVMKVRMVPIRNVFERFPRMMRDISKELGKDIDFNMSGEETELDRTVLDEIGQPIVHLLRNSIDHGIEQNDEREKKGKNPKGTISLKAYQEGNSVLIKVEDDGKGIDVTKVKRKAVEMGILNETSAEMISEEEAVALLFTPSFSTADKVTGLSGRGVGLDVVKTKIESLGGTMDVITKTGEGSQFIIRLPLTLAIIKALLVLVGDEKYAIALDTVQQIIKVPCKELKKVGEQEVITLREKVIPVLRLEEKLCVQRMQEYKPKEYTVVIIRKGDKAAGLIVDKVLSQQEIVQKSLGKYLEGIKTVTSATILGDGNVALILDTAASIVALYSEMGMLL